MIKALLCAANARSHWIALIGIGNSLLKSKCCEGIKIQSPADWRSEAVMVHGHYVTWIRGHFGGTPPAVAIPNRIRWYQ